MTLKKRSSTPQKSTQNDSNVTSKSSSPIQISKKLEKNSKVFSSIPTWIGIITIIVLLTSIFIASDRLYHSYPDIEDKCQLQTAFPASNMFCEKEALEYVRYLSDEIGNRLIGSKELEKSEEYILNVIRSIMLQSKLNNKVDVELQFQKATGNFLLEKFLGKDLIQAYHNVSNIIVKINPSGSGKFVEHETIYTTESFEPTKGDRNALLVNGHYDSAVGSPGGTDDGVPIGVMLSLLRNLVTTPTELKAPVVLLFNGGEEFGMHAAHGFISQHNWAKDIKTIINLESCGGGQGRPMLFQAGPGHGYAVKSYQKTSPYPQASVLAQDMMNIIPADTDYRVFTKHTNYFAAGMDLAFTRNGYVYHTSQDSYSQIQRGAVQHMGETVFSLVHDLTSNYLSKENINSIDEKYEPLFIEILGFYVIVWDYSIQSIAILSLIVLLVILFFVRVIRNVKFENSKSFVFSILLHFIALFISFFASIIASLIGAAILIYFGKTMAWYLVNRLGVIYYGGITCSVVIFINYTVNSLIRKIMYKYAKASNQSTFELAEEAQVWALHIYLIIMSILLQIIGLRTSIVFFGYSVVLALHTLSTLFFPLSAILRGVIVIVPLSVYQIYTTMLMLDAGWPFFGRLGSILNGEIGCSLYVTFLIYLNVLYILPSLQNVRKYHFISILSIIVTLVAFFFIYKQQERFSESRPRRFVTNHVRYLNPETSIIEKNYVHIGVLDSYEFEPSFSKFSKSNQVLSWEHSDNKLAKKDFNAAYPLSNVVRGAIINLHNNTEVGDVSPVKIQLKVLEEKLEEIKPNTWNRFLRVYINTDTKSLGGFTTIKIASRNLKSWSFNGDIVRDPENDNSIFIKLVGDGELEFTVNLQDTFTNEVNVKDQLLLQMEVNACISKRDKVLDHIHKLIENNSDFSEMNLQQFNTDWNI